MSVLSVLSSDPRDKIASGEFFPEPSSSPAPGFGLNTLRWINRFISAFKRELTSRQHRHKLGLALGGGFARCMAHIGMLKVLEEESIPVDLVAGTSAGAIIGAAYCAGISAGEMEEMASTARFRDFAR